MSPYRTPWGGYEQAEAVEPPETARARERADAYLGDPYWGCDYTHVLLAFLGHEHGRPLWRDGDMCVLLYG